MDLRRYMLTKKESIRDLRVEDRDIEAKENKNFITSVIGPRRAGKTYFLYNLIGIQQRKLPKPRAQCFQLPNSSLDSNIPSFTIYCA